MSEVFSTLKKAQGWQSGKNDSGTPAEKIESKTCNALSVSPKNDAAGGRTMERALLGVTLCMVVILVFSVVALPNSLASIKNSIKRNSAGINTLADKADEMRNSLKNATSDLIMLKDGSTRLQEAVFNIDRRFGSYDTLQKEVTGRINKLESSSQAISVRINDIESRAEKPAAPEKPQGVPSSQSKGAV